MSVKIIEINPVKYGCLRCGKEVKYNQSLCKKCDKEAETIYKKLLSKMDKTYFYIILIFVIGSCNRDLKLARKCAELFPVKDSLVITERRVVDTLVLPDSWVEYLDTTICPPAGDSSVIIKQVIKMVPGKTITVEKVLYDTNFIRENTAKSMVFNHQLDSLRRVLVKKDNDLEKSKGKTRGMFWAFIIVIAALVVVMLLTNRKKV